MGLVELSTVSSPSRGHGARALRIATAVVAVVALGACPAEATFPGRNAEIAYIDSYGGDYIETDLYTVCPSGRRERYLGGTSDMGSGAFSPDGRWLALDGTGNFDSWPIWLFDARNRGRRITRPGGAAYDGGPVWAPRGGAIAFTRRREDSNAVRIYSHHHGRFLGHGFAPAWSIRNQVAFTRLKHAHADDQEPAIFVAPARGGVPRRLVAGAYPDWSPDGRRLVFEAGAAIPDFEAFSPDYEIATSDARGAQVRTLARGRFPTWSPNGRWIAFMDSHGRAAVIAPSGERLRILGRRTDTEPMFSPDSKWLATSSGSDLYITRVSDGRRRYVTTADSGEDLDPVDWRPAQAASSRC
jgi:Tol biopolymer transport system component